MEAPMPALHEVDSYFPDDPQPTSLPVPVSEATKSFWLFSTPDCNPLAEHGRHDPLPSRSQHPVDVTIIGSGISGCFTLYHLIQALRSTSRSISRIVMLEARQFCSGATGRNGGHCTAYNPVAFKSLVSHENGNVQEAVKHVVQEQRSVDLVVRLIEENGWADNVDHVAGGNIHLITSQEERKVLEGQLAAAEEAGVDVSAFQWLTEEECKKYIKGKTGISGLRLPGNNLYPLKLMNKLFELACAQAAEIGVDVSLYTHTPVNSVSSSSGGSSSRIETARGSFESKQVVFATNAYTSHLLPHFATGPQKIVPCRGQVVAVRPKGDKQPFWASGFSSNEGFEYLFQRPAAKRSGLPAIPYVILGGGRSIAPKPYELDIADDGKLQPRVSTYLRDFLPDNFPSLFKEDEEVQVDFEWTGCMAFTTTRMPYVGQVYDGRGGKADGHWVLAGYSGHGMSRAPCCAEYIASQVAAHAEGKTAPLPKWMPASFLTKP